jgi:hypothetical protein
VGEIGRRGLGEESIEEHEEELTSCKGKSLHDDSKRTMWSPGIERI